MRPQIRDWINDSIVVKKQIYNSAGVLEQIEAAAKVLRRSTITRA